MAEEHRNHVLAVDDEEGILLLLTRILESTGYSVQTATDAEDALRLVAGSVPAVAICDVRMPGPSGLWLTEQLREKSPATAVILATADAPATPALPEGVIAYVQKPFDPGEVRRAVADGYAQWSARTGQPVPPLHPKRRRAAAPPRVGQ